MHGRVKFAAVIALLPLLAYPASAHAAVKSTKVTVTGTHSETLTVSKTAIKGGTAIRITGSRFDETVGIYLAFCVLPKKGDLPTPCGGGINKDGIGDASYWISSNPPPYGIGVAQEYLPGGRFSYVMHLPSMIGKINCLKTRCAITVRADHTRDNDRSYDLFVPINFLPLTSKIK